MMFQRDVSPEEQETVQKSQDPSVVVTPNGTATKEVRENVCDLDMSVHVRSLNELFAVLSLDKLCEENGY